MVKRMFKKGLVLGVIVLFVAVGFSSGIGVNDISISSFGDDSPPEVELIFYMSPTMDMIFEAICSDDTGIDRVEFTVDGGLWCIIPHEPYIWTSEVIPYNHIICAVAYDYAGNSAEDCIDFRSRNLENYRAIKQATSNMENQPPEPPTITGPQPKVGMNLVYTLNAVDPDGDDVSYFIDWGDGNSTGWSDYVPSGADDVFVHKWDVKPKFIRAKAKDIFEAESDWSYWYFRDKSSIRENNNEVKHETTVRIHNSRGIIPYTLKLTEKESDEIDKIFDNLKVRLDSTLTGEEIDEIYDKAVESLYELGFFPKMTLIEAKQLVKGKKCQSGNVGNADENFNCQIVGETTQAVMFDLDKPFWNNLLEFIRTLQYYMMWRFSYRFYNGKIGNIMIGSFLYGSVPG
jgi:hypothetical protein